MYHRKYKTWKRTAEVYDEYIDEANELMLHRSLNFQEQRLAALLSEVLMDLKAMAETLAGDGDG